MRPPLVNAAARSTSLLDRAPRAACLALAWAGLVGLTACKSADQRMREALPGAWERTASDESATYERRFFPHGIYVERRHDTSPSPPPGGRDRYESGTYRVEGKHLYLDVIEGPSKPSGSVRDAGTGSVDADELVLDEGKGPVKWARLHTPFPDNPGDVTAKALEKARSELARASGCLVGGKLDGSTAWAQLVGVARGVALLPAPPEHASKAPPWPASCAGALEGTNEALQELLTRDALDRCASLRHLLRQLLVEKPTRVAAYGKVDGEARRIDALAAEAARCNIVADPPSDAVPMDRGRPAAASAAVERGAPVVAPGTKTQVVTVFSATPAADSARFVLGAKSTHDGSAFEGVFCATRGGAAVTGIRCEPLLVAAAGGLRPLPSLAEDAPLWFTRGTSAVARPSATEIPLRGDFSGDGRAFIDRDATVRGASADGAELRIGADGKPVETPGPASPPRTLIRGDLRFVSTDDGFSVSRIGDKDPAKLGRSRLTSSYRDIEACHDGNHFGFVAHDEGHVVAGIPRLDGTLEWVDVELAAEDRSDQATAVGCEPGIARFVALSREGRIVRATCKPAGCKLERSEPLLDHGPGALAFAPLGNRVLVAKLTALPPAELGLRGQVAFRVADLAQIASTPDRLLLTEPDIDTPDSADPERLSMIVSAFATRSAAVVAVTSTSGLYLFRVDGDGSTKPLSP